MSLKDDYSIEPLPYQTAMPIIIESHYLHRKAPCTYAFGLINNKTKEIQGVIVYGVPASSTLLKGVCGPEEQFNVYELTRLWVDDAVPKNGESFLIGNTVNLLDREIVVSYADSSQDHIGIVYQATNWIYTGLSTKFRDPKVKGLEHQHHATYANGLSNQQVIDKFGEENVYFVERPRKHRYVFFNASKSRKKQLRQKLRYKVLPYPRKVI